MKNKFKRKIMLILALIYQFTETIHCITYKYLMLASNYPPMVLCEIGDNNKSNFKGLDIEMFNKIAQVCFLKFIDFF